MLTIENTINKLSLSLNNRMPIIGDDNSPIAVDKPQANN